MTIKEKANLGEIIPVEIYADTTGQFSEEEILAMQESETGAVITIPVPKDLLLAWYAEHPVNNYDFRTWWTRYSITPELDTLYAWLQEHGYCWRRLKGV